MENIKTGDLVTAYRAGIHRVIAITPRYKAAEYPYVSNKPTDIDSVGECSPLIKYQPVYNQSYFLFNCQFIFYLVVVF